MLGTGNAWIEGSVVTIWQSMAFNTLIYLSGLQTVDRDLYEAAALDGATGFRRFFQITFPLIAPFFTINMVLSGKNYLMAFDQFIAMTNGGPGTATTTISVLIYKKGFSGGQFAYQSANAVLLFPCGCPDFCIPASCVGAKGGEGRADEKRQHVNKKKRKTDC